MGNLIRSFLGLDGYYIRFIEGFSKLAMHLTQLTQKGQAYVWDALCEESFITQEEVDVCSSIDFAESE